MTQASRPVAHAPQVDASRAGVSWYLPSPQVVLLVGVTVYVLTLAVAPIDPAVQIGTEQGLMLLGYTVALLAGMLFGGLRSGPPRQPRWATASLGFDAEPLLRFTSTLAAIGSGLRLIDRFVLRPELIGANIDIVNEGSNLIGVVASLMYPLGIACLPLAFAIGTRRSVPQMIVLHALFFFSALDVMLVGKRGAAITVFAMYAFILLASRRLRVRLRVLVITAAAAFGALWIFGWIFARRVAGYGWDLCYSLFNSGYSQLVRPSTEVVVACQSPSFWSEPLQYFANFSIYFVHGIYEFAYAAPYYLREGTWAWGGQTFDLLAKPFCMLAGGECASEADAVRIGVYTTFWGPFFRDFGPWTAFAAFLLGFVIAKVRNRALDSFAYVPLYSYLAVVTVFTPVVNLIQSGLGMYFLVAASLFAFMYEYRRKKNANRVR